MEPPKKQEPVMNCAAVIGRSHYHIFNRHMMTETIMVASLGALLLKKTG